ncbi:FecR domain-containing protein [Mangrovibacterium marinum]|uniref:FecR family protein n=1 Tax=Mangrovibacterium marinum TaxID=1639118 RepID=UPI002A18954D|nr:FecR domain-containing protein [Mangrovibacterium marinum]
MRKNFKKAEDILTDDRLVAEIGDKCDQCSDANTDKQFKLAVRIYRALFKKRALIGKAQKQALGARIDQSINVYKRRIQFYRIAAAAVFIFLLAIPAFVVWNRESDLARYAQNAPDVRSAENTRLLLANKQVDIDTQKSSIEYLNNGNSIQIDASEQINQLISAGEVALNTLIVPYGKRTTITLSDQTKVWLNSGSRLIFPASFTKKNREVYLEGEAIFEVSHDKSHPFVVSTRNVDVEVLGTVFNLSAYNDDDFINTVLVEGGVLLKYGGNVLLGRQSSQLYPGMLASYNTQTSSLNKQKINTQLYTSWREGYLVFEQQPLGDIAKKIARYYDVQVVFDDPALAKETFSGNLDLQNSASEVLRVVAQIVNARIEQRDNQLIISKI